MYHDAIIRVRAMNLHIVKFYSIKICKNLKSMVYDINMPEKKKK